MESQEGHSVEAEQLIKKASDLSPRDPQIWLTWGNIKRKEDRVKEALSKYEEAYRLSPEDSVVLNSLGQAKARLGECEEADRLFKLAINKDAAGDSRKHQVINLSSMVDNLLRWSDQYLSDRDLNNARLKINEAIRLSKELINLDRQDIKSRDLYRLVLLKSGSFYIKNGESARAITYFEKAIVRNPTRSKEMNDTLIASMQLAKLYVWANDYEKAKTTLTPEIRRMASQSYVRQDLEEEFANLWNQINNSPVPLIGKVIRSDPDNRYVIIESATSSGSTYIGYFRNFTDQSIGDLSLLLGKQVSFFPYESYVENRLRKEATTIKVAN
jgi:tetratricopeptide (TPR) repeat protein